MKILYVVTVGGTMGFFKTFIKELIDGGDIVDIATSETDNVPQCYREWGCKIRTISCSQMLLKKGNVTAIREIRDIVTAHEYNMIHCHTPIAAACVRLACRPLRKKGIKVIYTAHGFHFYKGAPWKNWILYFTAEWVCSWFTDVIITINHQDYERAKRCLQSRSVKYIHGVGVDVSRFSRKFSFDVNVKRDEIGVPQGATVLLSVGALRPDKNQRIVIKALAKMNNPDIHYCIVGSGTTLRSLTKLAESLSVRENVHFLDYRSDIPELLWACDLFVFPSVFEGLPVALMEAMAAGVPIVCSSCRGNTDLIMDKRYQFKYNSVDECVVAIQYALSHDNTEYVERNKKRLVSFQKENVLKEMERLYREIDGSIQI